MNRYNFCQKTWLTNYPARRAYTIRPVVYVVVILSAKLSDSELSLVVYVVDFIYDN